MQAATLVDAPLLASLHTPSFDRPWGEAEFAALLAQDGVFALCHYHPERSERSPAPQEILRGNASQNDMLGFILCRIAADEAEILTFVVHSEARRQGIGQALLQAAIKEATGRGATEIFLEVSVANAAALYLYGKAGFIHTATRSRYYADGSDAMVLRRTLC